MMMDVSTIGSHWAFPWIVILIIAAVSFYIVWNKEMKQRKEEKEKKKSGVEQVQTRKPII